MRDDVVYSLHLNCNNEGEGEGEGDSVCSVAIRREEVQPGSSGRARKHDGGGRNQMGEFEYGALNVMAERRRGGCNWGNEEGTEPGQVGRTTSKGVMNNGHVAGKRELT
jgi:hypothetical protein